MPVPAASTIATHQAASSIAGAPSGVSTSETKAILLLMTMSAVVIFVQNARTGKPQSAEQFIAVGVVGFILLMLGNVSPPLGLSFAILFFVAIVLNSPNGVPLVAATAKKGK